MSLNKEQFEELKEAFLDQSFMMHQSTKRENSGLHGDLKNEIKDVKNIVTNYIETDEKWKKDVTPAITLVQNVQGFGKVSLWFLGVLGSVVGVIIAISKIKIR